MSIIVSRLLALVNTLTNVPIILHISRSAALRHIVSPTDRPVATSIRTSANIDPSLIQVTRHEDQETKKTRDEPKAVRAREEIGTVVVQLWLIGEETATGARGRARNPSVKCDIARHEVIRVAYRRERASLERFYNNPIEEKVHDGANADKSRLGVLYRQWKVRWEISTLQRHEVVKKIIQECERRPEKLVFLLTKSSSINSEFIR